MITGVGVTHGCGVGHDCNVEQGSAVGHGAGVGVGVTVGAQTGTHMPDVGPGVGTTVGTGGHATSAVAPCMRNASAVSTAIVPPAAPPRTTQ